MTEFSTEDIDLAAAIMASTGRQPEVFRQPGCPLVTFECLDDEHTRQTIFAYAGGDLSLPVRRFAACRSLLYRLARKRPQ